MPAILVGKLNKKERELLESKLKDKTMPVRDYERYRIVKEAAEGRRPRK